PTVFRDVGMDGSDPADEALTAATQSRAAGEFVRGSAAILLGLIVPAATAIPTTILVARGLGPADKGLWSLTVQLLFVVEQAAAFGTGAYYAVLLGRGVAISEIYGTAVAEAFAFPALVIVGAFAGGLSGHLPHDMYGPGSVTLLGVALVLLVM